MPLVEWRNGKHLLRDVLVSPHRLVEGNVVDSSCLRLPRGLVVRLRLLGGAAFGYHDRAFRRLLARQEPLTDLHVLGLKDTPQPGDLRLLPFSHGNWVLFGNVLRLSDFRRALAFGRRILDLRESPLHHFSFNLPSLIASNIL